MQYQRNHILYRVLDGFFRNWLVFVITLVGVTSVVGSVLIVRSAKFVAEARIRISSEDVNAANKALGFQENNGWKTLSDINASRFGDLMRDTLPGGFLDRVVKGANLAKPINTDPRAKDARFEEFRNAVYSNPLSSNVLEIGMTWADPTECESLVNSLQREFINQVAQDNSAAYTNTITFLDSQIEAYRDRLKGSEKALVDFKQAHAGLNPDSMTAIIDQVTSLKMQRDNLAITQRDADLRLQQLRDRLRSVKPVSVLEQKVGSDPALTDLRRLVEDRARRIREGWTPSSAVVTELDFKIKSIEGEVRKRQASDPSNSRNILDTTLTDNPEYNQLQQLIVEANISGQTQRAQMAQLDARIGQYEGEIAKLPADERVLTEKTRDYKLLQGQFEDLSERRQQAQIKKDLGEVTAASQFNTMNLVAAESTANLKKKILTIAAALALGLFLGLVLVVIREWMDPSIRYEADVERLLGVPVLVSLPESQQLRFQVTKVASMAISSKTEGK